jgi:hypothetical protein
MEGPVLGKKEDGEVGRGVYIYIKREKERNVTARTYLT